MPELPEVETFRKKLSSALKGKTIRNVHVHPDKIVFAKKSPTLIKKAFLGSKIKNCNRKGKYIWFELNHKPWPVFHLGMSGSYAISNELPDKKLKSVKLVLEMQDGTFMIFKDPRRFGRIFILDNPLAEKPLSHLGPDVLNELPSPKEIYSLLSPRRAPIKALLLDQSLLSGIGNWMADEILFQSGINPSRPAHDITIAEYKKLHSKISSVTKFAVKSNADYDKYPKTWLFHLRWGKKAGKISSGEVIKHSVVGGRSTAWVPAKQK